MIHSLAQSLVESGMDATVWHGKVPPVADRVAPVVAGRQRTLRAGDVLVMPEFGGAYWSFLVGALPVVMLVQGPRGFVAGTPLDSAGGGTRTRAGRPPRRRSRHRTRSTTSCGQSSRRRSRPTPCPSAWTAACSGLGPSAASFRSCLGDDRWSSTGWFRSFAHGACSRPGTCRSSTACRATRSPALWVSPQFFSAGLSSKALHSLEPRRCLPALESLASRATVQRNTWARVVPTSFRRGICWRWRTQWSVRSISSRTIRTSSQNSPMLAGDSSLIGMIQGI